MGRRYPKYKPAAAPATQPALPLTDADRAPLMFESWGAYCERAADGPSDLGYSDRSSRYHGESFTGTATFAAGVDLAVNGWAEGCEKAARLSYPLIDKLAARLEREDYSYATTGVTFDVARVLENEPECWIDYTPVVVEAPGRVLRLVFNAAASCGVSNEVIMAKGATVAALVALLERAGFRVQVDCVIAFAAQITHETWIPVKAAGQDLDLSRLIFALAHPSMLRRLWFSIGETFSPKLRHAMNVPGSRGCPTECHKDRQGDLYIGSSMYGDTQWSNEESAAAWILGQLAGQGVQVAAEAA